MKLLGGFALGIAAAGFVATAVLAQDAVKERQGLMKNVVAANMKAAGDMVKGTVAFDAAKAEAAMKEVAGVPDKFAALFPEGTSADNNPDTTAKGDIWSDMADFKQRLDELEKDAAAAAEAAKGGLDQFKVAFGAVAENCRGCHERYRVKKQ